MDPTQPITTPDGQTIHPSHPKFATLFAILHALIPFALAGASPFLKNANTISLVQAEAPIADSLFDALSKL